LTFCWAIIFFRQFGQVKLDYGDTPALGWIVIDACKEKNWKGRALCSVATRIPARAAALVPVSASGSHEGLVVIEAIRGLEDQKGVTIGRAVLPAWPQKDLWVYNVTGKDTIIVPGTVLGQMEPPGTEQLKPQEPPCKEPLELSEKETGEGGRLWAALCERIDLKIPPEVRQLLLRLLSNVPDCFAFSNANLGRCTVMKHRIDAGDAKPISRAPYPTTWKQRDLIRHQVK
jgi:hypothetical protein